MKKLFKWGGIGIAALSLLVVGVLALAPAFVDLEFVKHKAATAVAEATGRPLHIDGEVSLSLLPSPELRVTGLRFPNAEGGAPEPLLAVDAASARLNWLPLLSGTVHVVELRVVRPVLRLEVLADGRGNWILTPAPASEAGASTGTGPAVRLDRITLEAGRVSYRDAAAGIEESLEILDATAQAADLLRGPYRLSGRIGLRGEEISLTGDLGSVTSARPVDIDASATGSDFKLAVRGALGLGVAGGEARLALSGEGSDLARLLHRAGARDLPPGLPKGFAIEAELRRTGDAIALDPLQLRLGPSRAAGRLELELGALTGIDLRLEASEVPLDAFLPTAADAGPGRLRLPERLALPLPAGLRAELNLTATGLSWQGQGIGDVTIRGRLDGGRLSLDEARATLPGWGRLSLAGQAATDDGALSFDGTIEADLEAPRARLGLKANLKGSAEEVRLSQVVLQLDGSTVTASAHLTLGPHPTVTAEAALDRIELDRYLPAAGDGGTDGEPLSGLQEVLRALGRPLSVGEIEGRVSLAFSEIVYHGQSVKDGRLVALLSEREMRLEALSVADLAGGSLKAEGALMGLGEQPRFELNFALGAEEARGLIALIDPEIAARQETWGPVVLEGEARGDEGAIELEQSARIAGADATLRGNVGLSRAAPVQASFRLAAEDPTHLMRLFGLDPPKRLGALRARVEAKGNADASVIKGELTIAGGRLDFSGTLTELDAKPAFDLTIMGEQPRFHDLLRTVAPGYRPAAGAELGPLNFRVTVTGDALALRLSDVAVSLGEMRISGSAEIDASARTAELTLEAGRIDLDALLPEPSVTPTSETGTTIPDLGDLLPQDRSVRLAATIAEVIWRGDSVRDAVVRLALVDGALSVQRLSAGLPGATRLEISGKAAADGVAGFSGVLELTSDEARDFVRWLGWQTPDLPGERLRRLGLSATITGDVGRLRLTELTATLDESRVTGTMALVFAGRPRLDVDLALDRLDVDAYLPPASAGPADEGGMAGVGELLRALAPLADYDGSLKFALGEARFRGETVRGLALAILLAEGELVVERLEVTDLAGARLAADGRVEGLAESPAFRVDHTLRAEEAAGLARLAGLSPRQPDAPSIGPLTIAGRVNGNAERLWFSEEASLAGATLSLSADLGLVADAPVMAEGKFEIAEPARFARLFGYELAGPLSVTVLDVKASGTGEAADLDVRLQNEAAELVLRGRIALAGERKLDGRLRAVLHDSAALLRLVDVQPNEDAARLFNTLSLESDLSIGSEQAVLQEITGVIAGGEVAGGRIVVPFAPDAGYEVALRLAKLDLDPLLAAFENGGRGGSQGGIQAPPPAEFALPAGVQLDLALDIGTLVWRERTLEGLTVAARLADGRLNLERVAAALPGKGQASFAGALVARDGAPVLEGKLAADTRDLKALLARAGVAPPAVAKGYLGGASFAAALTAQTDRAQLSDLTLRLDRSRIDGRLEAQFGGRPRIEAVLSLDQLDLDGYLAKTTAEPAPAPSTPEKAPLAALATFDGELDLSVGRLSYAEHRFEKLRLQSTLDAETLRLVRLEVGDFLGAEARAEGVVRELAGAPSFELRYRAEVADTGPFFKLTGFAPPVPPKQIGALRIEGAAAGDAKRATIEAKAEGLDATLAVKGDLALTPGNAVTLTANLEAPQSDRLVGALGLTPPKSPGPLSARLGVQGTMAEAAVDASLAYAGGDLGLKGKLTALDRQPEYDLALRAEHPRLYELLKSVDATYEPEGGRDLGPLRLAGTLTGGAAGLTWSSLDVVVDRSRLTGNARLDLDGPRPRIVAHLASEGIDLRPLSPREMGSTGARRSGGGADDRVFSVEPLPFDELFAVDAEVELQARRLLAPRLALHEVVLTLHLADGELTVKPLEARVGGGRLNGRFTVKPRRKGGAMVATNVTVEQLDLAAVAQELETDKVLEGKLDGHLDLRGQGASAAQIMAGLDGETSLVVGRGRIDSRYVDLIGADLADNPLQFLSPGGGHTEINCMVSRFDVNKGLADSRAMVLDTRRMTVVGEGRVNLRNEALDIRIEPTPKSAASDTTGRLGLSLGGLARPFKLGGTLAHPAVAIDVAGTALTIGKAVGGAALFGPAGIAAALVTDTDSSGNACLRAIEAAEQGVAPPQGGGETTAPRPSRGRRTQETMDPLKRTLDDLQGTLKGIFGR